jgi:hypothetical protein
LRPPSLVHRRTLVPARPQVQDARVTQNNALGPVPEVDVMAKRPQGLLNVGTLSARMAVLRSCALDI